MSFSIVTWRSCIASSSAACVFGGARLISSARRRFAKIGPGRNSNSARALVEDRGARHVGGHQVGRELDAREPERARPGERAREQRLREAGVVLEQHVPVGEQREQDELERVALADDGLLDLVEDRAPPGRGARRAPSQAPPASSTSAPIRASGSPGPMRSVGLRPVGAQQLPRLVAEQLARAARGGGRARRRGSRRGGSPRRRAGSAAGGGGGGRRSRRRAAARARCGSAPAGAAAARRARAARAPGGTARAARLAGAARRVSEASAIAASTIT